MLGNLHLWVKMNSDRADKVACIYQLASTSSLVASSNRSDQWQQNTSSGLTIIAKPN